MPGVIAVLTGSDAAGDGLQPISHSPVPANPREVPFKSRDGSPFFVAPHPVLVVGKVRHVGEAIAVVVAETMSQATDAAERVEVQYEPLPVVTRSTDALAPEAPLVWEEHGANVCADSEAGDQEATDAAFARATHVVRLETAINRVTGVPMELRTPSASTTRTRSGTPFTPAPAAAWCGSAPTSPPCSGYRPPPSASCQAMSAAISASATAPVRNSRWLPGRRDGSGGRSSGSATAVTRSSPTSTAAT